MANGEKIKSIHCESQGFKVKYYTVSNSFKDAL
jgi:hypothetical protein